MSTPDKYKINWWNHKIYNIDFHNFVTSNHILILIDSRNIYGIKSLPKGTIYSGVDDPFKKFDNW
jgi:hypothetical protein